MINNMNRLESAGFKLAKYPDGLFYIRQSMQEEFAPFYQCDLMMTDFQYWDGQDCFDLTEKEFWAVVDKFLEDDND